MSPLRLKNKEKKCQRNSRVTHIGNARNGTCMLHDPSQPCTGLCAGLRGGSGEVSPVTASWRVWKGKDSVP